MNDEGGGLLAERVMEGERDLRERTTAFAVRVVRMFSGLPTSTEGQVLGKQVLRSGTAVGANFREAHRARSKAEFVAKIGDCLKELDETSYWFELLVECEIVSEQRLVQLQDECHQLIAILVTIAKRTKDGMRKEQGRDIS